MKCESEQAATGAMFDAFRKEVLRNTVLTTNVRAIFSRKERVTNDPTELFLVGTGSINCISGEFV